MSPGDPHPALADGPSRAASWRLRTHTLRFGPLPMLMGIVNVTPDSFSDGGRFLDPKAAIDHALRLAAEGAAILDIGGESTRPGSSPVPAVEQLRRVLPVIQTLAALAALAAPAALAALAALAPPAATAAPGTETVPLLSIDTSSAEVAREALAAGAQIVNDVTALTGDPAMLPLVAESGAGVCLMHMQGTPRTMQQQPVYQDVVGEVFDYLRARRDALVAAGIAPNRIALDPGIGFGKTTEHNLALLAACPRLHRLGCPVLVGVSRKRFLRELASQASGRPTGDPLYGTIGTAIALAAAGVHVLRVHDVAPVREALAAWSASHGAR